MNIKDEVCVAEKQHCHEGKKTSFSENETCRTTIRSCFLHDKPERVGLFNHSLGSEHFWQFGKDRKKIMRMGIKKENIIK